MELDKFVKDVILQLNTAVLESNAVLADQKQKVVIFGAGDNNDIQFDIAISASDTTTGSGGASIKVLTAIDIGGKISAEEKSSRVSRIQFGVGFRTTEPLTVVSGGKPSAFYGKKF